MGGFVPRIGRFLCLHIYFTICTAELVHFWSFDGPEVLTLRSEIDENITFTIAGVVDFERAPATGLTQGTSIGLSEAGQTFVFAQHRPSLAIESGTVSFHFRADSVGVLLSKTALPNLRGDLEIEITLRRQLRASVWVNDGPAGQVLVQTDISAIEFGQFYRVTCAFGKSLQLFLDGVLVGQRQTDFPGWVPSIQPITLAKRLSPPEDRSTILMDNLAIFDEPLSDQQVQNLLACRTGSPCAHGNCTASEAGFSCGECPAGLTGQRCDEDLNACGLNPCLPGESCLDLPPPADGTQTGRICSTCEAGFKLVEGVCLEINGCEDLPCSPNATNCTDLGAPAANKQDGRTCGPCLPGFAGDGNVCEPVCDSVTCVRGTCQPSGSTFQCGVNGMCPDQSAGQRCEEDTRLCTTSPWSAWSRCSKACDTGTRQRARLITRFPTGAGFTCPETSQSEDCNVVNCVFLRALPTITLRDGLSFTDAEAQGSDGVILWAPPAMVPPEIAGLVVFSSQNPENPLGFAQVDDGAFTLPMLSSSISSVVVKYVYEEGLNNFSDTSFSLDLVEESRSFFEANDDSMIYAGIAVFAVGLIFCMVACCRASRTESEAELPTSTKPEPLYHHLDRVRTLKDDQGFHVDKNGTLQPAEVTRKNPLFSSIKSKTSGFLRRSKKHQHSMRSQNSDQSGIYETLWYNQGDFSSTLRRPDTGSKKRRALRSQGKPARRVHTPNHPMADLEEWIPPASVTTDSDYWEDPQEPIYSTDPPPEESIAPIRDDYQRDADSVVYATPLKKRHPNPPAPDQTATRRGSLGVPALLDQEQAVEPELPVRRNSLAGGRVLAHSPLAGYTDMTQSVSTPSSPSTMRRGSIGVSPVAGYQDMTGQVSMPVVSQERRPAPSIASRSPKRNPAKRPLPPPPAPPPIVGAPPPRPVARKKPPKSMQPAPSYETPYETVEGINGPKVPYKHPSANPAYETFRPMAGSSRAKSENPKPKPKPVLAREESFAVGLENDVDDNTLETILAAIAQFEENVPRGEPLSERSKALVAAAAAAAAGGSDGKAKLVELRPQHSQDLVDLPTRKLNPLEGQPSTRL